MATQKAFAEEYHLVGNLRLESRTRFSVCISYYHLSSPSRVASRR